VNPNLQLDSETLAAFCRKWRVRELSVFGSALRDDFGPDSDVDVLVSFETGAPLDLSGFLDMKEELETQCGRAVDLVDRETLRNPWMRHEILRTRKTIYADWL
jgi:predicted nucleotidyltransferase